MAATNKTRIGVLLSGTGRTLVNLLERIEAGTLDAEIVCVVADRDGVRGLDHGRAAGLPTTVTKDPATTFAFLESHQVDLVCLCGYLRLLKIPDHFARRVINIHPSLLPKYGGKGFYGNHVHAAVLAAGESESGCTVHFCDEVYDQGAALLQHRVPVEPGDDVKSLAARVFAAECEAYPEAIRQWIANRRPSQ